MLHRDRIAALFAGQLTDRPGFWLGEPHEDLSPRLWAAWGVGDDEGLRRAIDDDCRWIGTPEWAAWRHPEGAQLFDCRHGMPPKKGHADPGCFADCTEVAAVERHPWPDAAHIHIPTYRRLMEGREDCWRMGGTWGCFFHIVMDYFGIEEYFMKMHTHPAVVHAVTRRVVDFYLAVNERVLRECPEAVDCVFIGNDFGSQESLLISPRSFREFVLPYFRELIDQAKLFGKPVQLHSCGAINCAIPMLLDAGIDALHPLQARAKGMDAATLGREYGGRLVFVGGIDTQDLLWRGTPQQVYDEVSRLRDHFGGRWIASPSHEKLMPEVTEANVAAMVAALTGRRPPR
jgi:uroporphyrinogen decarboxylase